MARTPVEVRRKMLIAAALRVIGSRGLHEATTRAIVAEAGMSLASFHYAFESRSELIDRLIVDVVANEETAIVSSHREGATLVEVLTDALMGYVAHLQADPAREQAMLELTLYALRTRHPLARMQYAKYAEIVAASLEKASEQTGTRWTVPLPSVVKLIVALTDGLTLSWLVDRDDSALEVVAASAAATIASLSLPVGATAHQHGGQ